MTSSDASSFPRTPAAVTAAWLESVLGAEAGTLAAMAHQVIGTGQVGDCARFTLGWEEAAAATSVEHPASLICKFAASNEASREAGRQQQCYVREVGFYQHLQHGSALRTPRCWSAHLAPNEVDSVLVLEDLTPAQPGDQLLGCSAQQARAAVEELAKLHAAWWGQHDQLDRFDWLPAPSAEASIEVAERYEAVRGAFSERYAGRLSAPVFDLVAAIGPLIRAGRPEQGTPRTLVHRDFRCDNLLFAAPGQRRFSVCTVDWQTIGQGSGAADLAYFLGGSVRTSVRRNHEQRLVQAYHRELERGGVSDYGFDQCWLDYRVGAIGGLVMAVTASMLVGATERGDEMFVTMARRHAAHALDLDVDQLVAAQR